MVPPQSAIHGLEISTISSSAIVFLVVFFKNHLVMSRRKQRSVFDQVSEFDRGRIVAYRDIVDYLSEKSVVVLDETKQL
ncbi:hypothetical protein TNCV_1665581 [Trichonephila clavipes]|nr:hypothetical protein TNCV_1665581 [Trichonephila clavipes]